MMVVEAEGRVEGRQDQPTSEIAKLFVSELLCSTKTDHFGRLATQKSRNTAFVAQFTKTLLQSLTDQSPEVG